MNVTKIGVALATAAFLVSGCGSDTGVDEVSGVCVNRAGERVPDTACESNGGMSGLAYSWFYLPTMLTQPGYYSQVVHNHYYTDGNPYGPKPPTGQNVAVQRVPKDGAPAKAVNPAPKVNSPQDKPNPNVKQGGVNPAPKPLPAAPKAPAPAPRK
jgi:hypothetical protein